MTLPEKEQLAARPNARTGPARNLAVVDDETASPEVQQLFAHFRQHFGRPQVPGILRCFATHPPLLEHMMGLAQEMLFVDGALGRQNKEMISAFVSASNRCDYCADSHAYSFRLQGGTRDATDAVLACDAESSAVTSAQRTLLLFAQKITDDSETVTLEDINALRAAGFDDLQIAEAIHVAALFAAFNRVVNAFGLPSQQLLRGFDQELKHGR
ncbi:MAG: peroxidase-related enzyme [Acidobacteriota bacterium]|nr:peroxidase-related enzyme [Acidobacteriota bacterium]